MLKKTVSELRKNEPRLFTEGFFEQTQYNTWRYRGGKDALYGCTYYISDNAMSNGGWIGGSASFSESEDLASVAMIEAYERLALTSWRVDYECSLRAMKSNGYDVLDPRTIVPLSKKQAAASGVSIFDENTPILWRNCHRYVKGDLILIPADLIHYGRRPFGYDGEYPRIFHGNSSGAASFTNYDEAVKRAALELLERDALMRMWYSESTPQEISKKSYPRYLQGRYAAFEYTYEKVVKCFALKSEHDVIVVLAVITGNEYPYFIAGASATFGNAERAMEKALLEAEFIFHKMRTQMRPNAKVNKKKVFTPQGHITYYANCKDNNLSWLWGGGLVDANELVVRRDYRETLSNLDLLVADISTEGSPLTTVKVFSQELVPLTFGYRMELFDHPAIRGRYKEKDAPHFFG